MGVAGAAVGLVCLMLTWSSAPPFFSPNSVRSIMSARMSGSSATLGMPMASKVKSRSGLVPAGRRIGSLSWSAVAAAVGTAAAGRSARFVLNV